MLAQTVARSVQEEDPRCRRDLRAALTHAQAVVEGRRRWDGRRSAALALVIEIQIGFGDASEAVRLALPESLGGAARDAEGSDPEVARRGAFAALISGNTDPAGAGSLAVTVHVRHGRARRSELA
jgi:hypothetical protein